LHRVASPNSFKRHHLKIFECQHRWLRLKIKLKHGALCGGLIFQRAAPANGVLDMLHYALVFLVVAIVAGVLGFGGIAGTAAAIAKILFFVFLILFLIGLVAGRRTAV
jgi:uncharacterized membrane protein YtjA (UPF0391 family)